jgi:putative transposase
VRPATQRELAAQIQYLKAENQILRSKLTKRIVIAPAERARLARLGMLVGGCAGLLKGKKTA